MCSLFSTKFTIGKSKRIKMHDFNLTKRTITPTHAQPVNLHHFQAITTCWLNNNICSLLISNAGPFRHMNTSLHSLEIQQEWKKLLIVRTTVALIGKSWRLLPHLNLLNRSNNVHIKCPFLCLGRRYCLPELINTLAKYLHQWNRHLNESQMGATEPKHISQ